MGNVRYHTQKTPKLEAELRAFLSSRMGAHYLDHTERYKQNPDGQNKQVLVTVFFIPLENLATQLPAYEQVLAQHVVALFRKPSGLRHLLPRSTEEVLVRYVVLGPTRVGPALSSKIWERGARTRG